MLGVAVRYCAPLPLLTGLRRYSANEAEKLLCLIQPVGVVSELIKGDVFFWGSLMAGALFGSIPVAFVYSFFVENYVSGMTGAVNG